jgi:hypothetical protein
MAHVITRLKYLLREDSGLVLVDPLNTGRDHQQDPRQNKPPGLLYSESYPPIAID